MLLKLKILAFTIGLLKNDPAYSTILVSELYSLKYENFPEHFLMAKCWSESRCKNVEIHDGDRNVERTVWRRAVDKGLLRPDECSEHASSKGASAHGPHGLIAAYNIHLTENLVKRLIGVKTCLSYDVLDNPLVSAFTAAEKVMSHCSSKRSCSEKRLAVFWAGRRKPEIEVFRRYRKARLSGRRKRWRIEHEILQPSRR